MKVKITTLLVLSAILLVIFILYRYAVGSPFLLSSALAKQKLANKEVDVVLDVRTKLEYNLGHYPDALHIPTALLAAQATKAIPNKNTRILVYCNTGQRSRRAAELLQAKGYKNTRYIAGPYWSLLR